jgi:hypothetical protein
MALLTGLVISLPVMHQQQSGKSPFLPSTVGCYLKNGAAQFLYKYAASNDIFRNTPDKDSTFNNL